MIFTVLRLPASLYLLLSAAVQWSRGHEPVWRQVLQHLLNDSDPSVAQQAVAALAE